MDRVFMVYIGRRIANCFTFSWHAKEFLAYNGKCEVSPPFSFVCSCTCESDKLFLHVNVEDLLHSHFTIPGPATKQGHFVITVCSSWKYGAICFDLVACKELCQQRTALALDVMC